MNVTSKTVQPHTLEMCALKAAQDVGVRLYNFRQSGKSGIAFTLKTGEPTELRINNRGKLVLSPKYQRLSQRMDSQRVVPGAVCWHGHRDWFRAFYRLVPDAKIRTSFITYQSAQHFEDNFEGTYNGPAKDSAGSFAGYARPYQDACTCEE